MREKTQAKLNYLAETKSLIKSALIEKGQTVADEDDFRSYVDKIKAIESGGTSGNVWETVPVIPAKLSALPYRAFVFNHHIYVVFKNADTSANEIWWLDDDGWKYLNTLPTTTGVTGSNAVYIEFNGELHFLNDQATSHHFKYDFNAGEWVEITTIPSSTSYTKLVFVCNGELYAMAGSQGKDLYKFDGTVWNLINTSVVSDTIYLSNGYCVKDDKLYYVRNSTELYSFDPITQTETSVGSITGASGMLVVIGDIIYLVPYSYSVSIRKYVDGQIVDTGTYNFLANTNVAQCVLNNKLYCFGTGNNYYGYKVGCCWTPPQ